MKDGGGGKWKIEQCSVRPETAKRVHMVNKRELLVLLIVMLDCMLSTFDEANFIIGNRK